jgi:hypothetical protein
MRDAQHRAGELLGRGVIGPVNDQRIANDIFARHKTPVPAVERRVAIVAGWR